MSGGNKTINKRDTLSMLRDMNQQINNIMKDSTSIQRVIDNFLADCGKGKTLQGDGFEAAENYFSCTYKELLHDLNSVCALMANQNNKLIAAINMNITLSNYNVMKQQKLREDVISLKHEVEHLSNLMKKGNHFSGGSVWADTDSRYSFYITRNKEQIQALEAQIERMDDLEVQTQGLYDEIRGLIKAIQEGVEKISAGKYFDSKNGMFKVPDLNLGSTRRILDMRVKDEKLNIEALDPVNMATGNYMYRKNFLVTSGVVPLSLEITYNSCDNFKRRFASAGWTHNHKTELTIYKSKIVLNIDSGRQETYIKEGDEYKNEDGDRSRRLTVCTSNDYAYRYINEKHEKYYFDEMGRCLKQITSDRRTIRFEYDDLILKKLSTEFGTGYVFEYDFEEDGTPYATKISDFSGRNINFKYSDISDEFSKTGKTRVLTEIYDEMGKSYSFRYNELCKMYTVTNARGTVNLINEYDGSGRVTRQVFPDGGEITIEYYDIGQNVIATHQNGSQTTYVHDKKFRSTITKTGYGYEEFKYTDSNNRKSFRDRNGNITDYRYDASGNVVWERTPAGDIFETVYSEADKPLKVSINGITILKNEYDENGNIISSNDAVGRITEFQYNKHNLPVKITNPDGTTMRLKYDERGNISEEIDEVGNISKYEYDNLNRVISYTDGNGNSFKFNYNARNEITESIDPLGQKRVFEYNESGKPIRIVDYDGYEELLNYNELNKISKYVDKDGSETEFSYNKMWQIEKTVDPVGAKTIYTYNSEGNLVRTTDATFASITYSYDACGNIVKIRDQEGNVTKYAYDAMNRLIKSTMHDGSTEHYEYDVFGNETKFVDALGGEWISEYDAAGQKIKDIYPDGTETKYEYDLCGNLIEECHLGQSIKYSYDAAKRLAEIIESTGVKTKYSYDANGNIVMISKAGVEKTYEYDCLSRITKELTAGNITASYEYDGAGNIISITDGLGNKTRYVRSKAGYITSVIDPLGNVTRYRYDKAHRLMNIVQGEGNEADSIDINRLNDIEEVMRLNRHKNSLRVISYGRDILGRVISVTDALGNTERYEYDKRGFVSAKTDMDGNRTGIGRTHLGDISHLAYSDNTRIEYKYDPLRRLKEIKDTLGITRIERDSLGRETSITDHKGRNVSYSYDDLGNRTSIRYAHGKDVRYAYNEGGLLTGIDCGDEKVRLSYDGYGRISSKRIGSSETRYSYNGLGYLASLVNTDNGKLLDSYEYAYDVAGNLTSSKQVREGLPAATGLFEYGYDAIGRLNTVTRDGSLLRNYLYDAFGNRTSLSENGGNTVYEYNKANQLIRTDSPNGATSFEYDKRGNVVRKNTANGVSINYTYGAKNRLIQATRNTDGRSQTAKYVYNGLGMRVSRITDDGSVDYILDQTKMYNNLLEKVRNERAEEYIWYDNDLVMAGEEQVLTGRLSTVERAPCMAFGAFAYDEFGVPLSGNGSPTVFTGYIHDDIADTYFAQAREYMPEIGRFAGRDILKGQIEIPRSLNEYSYCHNDPVGFVDLNGMKEKKGSQDPAEFNIDYVRNQASGKVIEKAEIHLNYKIREYNVLNKYSREYDVTKQQFINERIRTGNPRAGTGRLSWQTRSKNVKLGELQYERDVARGKIRDLSAKYIGKAGLKSGVIGGAVDVGFGLYEDYNGGLSGSKMASNTAVNFAFGAAEGAFIGVATAAFGPAGFIAASVLVWAFERFTRVREKTKESINSLD